MSYTRALSAVLSIVAFGIALVIFLRIEKSSHEVHNRNGEEREKQHIAHIPLVILKLPRSGSSWFTEKLNELPTVFISKEIIQRGDKERFGLAEMEAHLIRALNAPTGKLSSAKDYLPTGRFFEDYLVHKSFKVLRSLQVVGFTLNPEHVVGLDWRHVLQAVPSARLVLLIRSNTIKSALSGYRGKQTSSLCGSSNMRWSNANCTPPAFVEWSPSEFAQQVAHWQYRYDSFVNFVKSDATLSRMPVRIVYYEALQANLYESLDEFFAALEANNTSQKIARSPSFSSSSSSSSSLLPLQKILSKISPQSGWLKRTSDDLSSILTYYDEIEAALQRDNCTCFLEQLRSQAGKVFSSICNERFTLPSGKCNQ